MENNPAALMIIGYRNSLQIIGPVVDITSGDDYQTRLPSLFMAQLAGWSGVLIHNPATLYFGDRSNNSQTTTQTPNNFPKPRKYALGEVRNF